MRWVDRENAVSGRKKIYSERDILEAKRSESAGRRDHQYTKSHRANEKAALWLSIGRDIHPFLMDSEKTEDRVDFNILSGGGEPCLTTLAEAMQGLRGVPFCEKKRDCLKIQKRDKYRGDK